MKTFNEQTTAAMLKSKTALEAAVHRLGLRMRDEAGQTTAEYVAVIVLIAAIIGSVLGSGTIRQAIVDAIVAAFNNVKDSVS